MGSIQGIMINPTCRVALTQTFVKSLGVNLIQPDGIHPIATFGDAAKPWKGAKKVKTFLTNVCEDAILILLLTPLHVQQMILKWRGEHIFYSK